MNRQTIITIIIGVFALLVIGLLWFWFFGSSAPTPAQTGTFGTGQGRTTTPAQGGSAPTNIPNSIGQTVGSNGGLPTTGGYVTGAPGAVATGAASSSYTVAPGVNWLSGGSTGGGSGTVFNPAAINQLNNGSVGGTVNVLGTFTTPGSSGGGSGIGGAAALLGATAIGCLVFMAPGAGAAPSFPPALYVQNSQSNNKSFMDCLARTIARAAVQQLTNSVVNWINSGFNGQPSFVTNYQQFFASVADQAAGEFIKTATNFAPYCTPFRTQIQIALANSYARRNTAPACTLSTLLGVNVPQFLNGNFSSSGGWKSLISFTSTPNNNPYGAYMSAQAQLQSNISQAAQTANRNISPGGFLNFQQAYDCQSPANNGSGASVTGSIGNSSQSAGSSCPSNCKCRVTTPGATIQDSLSKTLGVSQDTLTQAGISGSFDAIIGALISQLMTRALQGGVSNLSGTNGYASYYLTADQQAAQSGGQTLLTQLQGLVVVAQQYGQSEQGSISDIQNAQSQVNSLANCWQTAASSTALTDSQQNIAYSNGQSALSTLHTYDTQVTALNTEITRANAAIATLQNLQTQTLNVGSTADVATIQSSLDAAIAQGAIISPADLTQAQQDRTTLQSQLGSLSQSTNSQLTQCYAFH